MKNRQKDSTLPSTRGIKYILSRINVNALQGHLIMKMGPRASPGISDCTDSVATLYFIAMFHGEFLQVRVASDNAMSMIDDSEESINALFADKGHYTGGRGYNLRAFMSCDVQSFMEFAPSGKRRSPVTKTR